MCEILRIFRRLSNKCAFLKAWIFPGRARWFTGNRAAFPRGVALARKKLLKFVILSIFLNSYTCLTHISLYFIIYL